MLLREQPGVVIVGAGHAGGRTAERLRHFGWNRPIDVVGAEPELPYERPPLSKAFLTAAELPARPHLLSAARWGELGVRFHLGKEATRIDRAGRKIGLSTGETLPYAKLVLATGLTPRKLPVLDAVANRVLFLRDHADALRLRERIGGNSDLVIVGAGLIGLEVASSARGLGARVTVVEAAASPLGRMLPPYLGDWVAGLHRRAGVRLLCGRQVTGALEEQGRAVLTLDDGSAHAADAVLVGIGGVPNDGLARAAGLAAENGVLVDKRNATSDPHIFAVGDLAASENRFLGRRCRLESWKNAEDQAANAAAAICRQPPGDLDAPWFWTDQYELNIQMAGAPPSGVPAWERGKLGERGYLAYFTEGESLRAAIGIGCGRDIRIAREVIKAGRGIASSELVAKGFVSTVAAGRGEAARLAS